MIHLVLIIISLVLVVGLLVWVVILHTRLNKLTRGNNGSLEQIITKILEQNDAMSKEHAELLERYITLGKKIESAMRGFAFVKFNPFGDDTTKQSFALALINEHGDGTVISTLYARERMSVFGKEIKHFTCEKELTAEEKKALDEARVSL